MGNYEKAIYYALESIKNVNNKYDSSGLNAFYARVAYYYTATGSAADAVLWNFKRLEHLIAEKKSGSAYGTIYLIVSDLVILGREQEALKLIIDKSKTIVPDGDGQKVGMLLSFAKSYAAVKNYSAAERYCEEAIKLDEEMRKRKQTGTATLYNFLALFYLDIGQYDKAEKYKKLDYTVSSASSNSDFYFKLDSARGNYLSAIKHLQA